MSTKYLCALCGEPDDPQKHRVVWTFSKGSICSDCFRICAQELQGMQTRVIVAPRGQQTPPPHGTPTPVPRKDTTPIEKIVETLLRGIALNRTVETIVHQTGRKVHVLSKNPKSTELDVSTIYTCDKFEPILTEFKRLCGLAPNGGSDQEGKIVIPALFGTARHQYRVVFQTNELYGEHVVIYF